jgi:hypothetical protein
MLIEFGLKFWVMESGLHLLTNFDEFEIGNEIYGILLFE